MFKSNQIATYLVMHEHEPSQLPKDEIYESKAYLVICKF